MSQVGLAAEQLGRRDEGVRRMAGEVASSLRSSLPWLPSKYLYDDRGSELFEEITQLPEYYQTRTEEAILEAEAPRIVAAARPSEIVELGSGAGRKVRLLLDAGLRGGTLARCVMQDINETFLEGSVDRLSRAYPSLAVRGVAGDFTRDLGGLGRASDRLVILLAGTFGNLLPETVPGFLERVRTAIGPSGAFLVGVDLVKDVGRLEAAYNDAAGVTAAFNLNMLANLNTTLGADFDLEGFEHRAFYDAEHAWIEMRVRAKRAMRVRIPAAGLVLHLASGDEIRTEVSCKYTRSSLEALLAASGLELVEWYADPDALFADALAVPVT